MNWQKLNPWNWFKHEEPESNQDNYVPVTRTANKSKMPVTQSSLSHPVMQLHDEFNRLFDNVFKQFGMSPLLSSSHHTSSLLGNSDFWPSLNISSDGKTYLVTLDVPGMKQADMEIEVRGGILAIKGQKQEEVEDKERYFYRVERSYGVFQRTLDLPEDANADDINATMQDGVLSLTIPRNETKDKQVKRIAIT